MVALCHHSSLFSPFELVLLYAASRCRDRLYEERRMTSSKMVTSNVSVRCSVVPCRPELPGSYSDIDWPGHGRINEVVVKRPTTYPSIGLKRWRRKGVFFFRADPNVCVCVFVCMPVCVCKRVLVVSSVRYSRRHWRSFFLEGVVAERMLLAPRKMDWIWEKRQRRGRTADWYIPFTGLWSRHFILLQHSTSHLNCSGSSSGISTAANSSGLRS